MDRKYIYASFGTFFVAILVVAVMLNGSYASSNVQFMGAGSEGEYDMMTCSLTFVGCDAATMSSYCAGYGSGGSLSGSTCTWEMVDNGVNRCGSSTYVCSTSEPEEPEEEEPEVPDIPGDIMYDCTTSFSSCNASQMQSYCDRYGGTLSGGVCSYQAAVCGSSNVSCAEIPEIPMDPPVEDEQECWICRSDNTLFYWGIAPAAGSYGCDSHWRSAGSYYTEASCRYDEPGEELYAYCYACSTNNNLFYWGTTRPATGSNNCSGTWTIDATKTERTCVTQVVVPEPEPEKHCYVCGNDNTKFYWGASKPSDNSNSCSGSWNLESSITTEANCEYTGEEDVINPNTGSWLLYVVYLVGILSLGYTGYYAYKLIKVRNK